MFQVCHANASCVCFAVGAVGKFAASVIADVYCKQPLAPQAPAGTASESLQQNIRGEVPSHEADLRVRLPVARGVGHDRLHSDAAAQQPGTATEGPHRVPAQDEDSANDGDVDASDQDADISSAGIMMVPVTTAVTTSAGCAQAIAAFPSRTGTVTALSTEVTPPTHSGNPRRKKVSKASATLDISEPCGPRLEAGKCGAIVGLSWWHDGGSERMVSLAVPATFYTVCV